MCASKLVHTTRFWNNLHQIRPYQKIGKLINSKVFGINESKGHTQDSYTRLWLPMPETLTTEMIIPAGTNNPPEEVSNQ
jgi:hypothetical protein